MKNKALKLLKEFTDEYLHGNIDELTNFSFWDIWGRKEFDNGKGYPDGDCTKIVYAIDYLLYFDRLDVDNFSLPYYLIDGKYFFSGDTIHSFRTLFGNRFLNNGESKVEKKFNFTLSEIAIKNDFFRTYQKIGNFYLLPSLTDNKKSINTFRGDYKRENAWFDYFDLFLNELKTRLPFDNTHENDSFQNLLRKNNFFFNKNLTYEKFLDIFYLSDYKEVKFNHTKQPVHWWMEISESEYKHFAFDYVAKATELINNRSRVLVNALKEKLKESDFQKEYLK